MAATAADVGQRGYIPPAAGVDALKDALAVIRCTARGDAEGLTAILSGAVHAQVTGMLMAVSLSAFRSLGMDDRAIVQVLPPADLASQPARFAPLLAAAVVDACRRAGLDDAEIDALLGAIRSDTVNYLLEQAAPREVIPVGR